MSDGEPEEAPVCPECEGTGVYEPDPDVGSGYEPCPCGQEGPEVRG
jgi:hypothetical protein